MTISLPTLHRLALEAQAESDRAPTSALGRAFAQLAAAYATQAVRQSAWPAAQPLAQAHWKL
ncbi:hypothetical protein [uncultured Sphingomonas sp.]|uniref:hypothetical protein n=1 Tax=uncultured Sphingomonas sp. TaxID=158754 RepID=UPI00259A612C|nr:hypothetical protein [uncultured Sphingomonas sp.]